MKLNSLGRYGLSIAGVVVFIVMLSSISLAQPQRLTPEERTAQLTKDLSLSEEQVASVLKIYQDQQKEMKQIFESSGEDFDARREMMMKKGKETDEKIAAVLDKTQKEKFAEIQKQRRSRPGQVRKLR